MDKFLIVTNQDKDRELRVTKEIKRYIESRDCTCHLAEPLAGTDLLQTG